MQLKLRFLKRKIRWKVCKTLTEEKYKQIGICFTNYIISPEIKFRWNKHFLVSTHALLEKDVGYLWLKIQILSIKQDSKVNLDFFFFKQMHSFFRFNTEVTDSELHVFWLPFLVCVRQNTFNMSNLSIHQSKSVWNFANQLWTHILWLK